MPTKINAPEAGANGQTLEAPPTALAAAAGVTRALSREAHSFLADIEELVKATTSLTGDDLARAKTKLVERVAEARASVEKVGGAIADGTRQAAKATDGFVHERPWQAIGIGAALGLLAGFALARR